MSIAERLRDSAFDALPAPDAEEQRAIRVLDTEFQGAIIDRPLASLRVGSVVDILAAVNTLVPYLRLLAVVLHARASGVGVKEGSDSRVRLVTRDADGAEHHAVYLPRFGSGEEARAWLRQHGIPILTSENRL